MLILPTLDSLENVLLLLLSEGIKIGLIHLNLHFPYLILNRMQDFLEGHIHGIDGRFHSTVYDLEYENVHTVLNVHAWVQQFIIDGHSNNRLRIAILHLLPVDL